MLLYYRQITLHNVKGKSLKLGIQSPSRSRQAQAAQKNINQAEIAESEGIEAIVYQMAIQAVRGSDDDAKRCRWESWPKRATEREREMAGQP